MFAKTFKIKSSNTLKNTEKKHLANKIQAYINATEEEARTLVPVKCTASCMKVMLHSGELISVYVVDNVPIIIEARERVYPTVCALWKIPDLIPVITIHSPVLSKLQNGVPLYQPGVVMPEDVANFPVFNHGCVIGVNTEHNAAAAAVGTTAMTSGQIYMGQSGVALEPIQVFGDYLCKVSKFNKIERPVLPPPTYEDSDGQQLATNMHHVTLNEQQRDVEWPSLSLLSTPRSATAPPMMQPTDDVMATVRQIQETDASENDLPTDMDGLLKYSLLSFIKLEGKKVELPLKTNLLYRNHLVALCPVATGLDVKKSSYKKLSKFLETMQKEGLIEVKEVEKGVDALVSVNTSHSEVRSHAPALTTSSEPERTDTEIGDYVAPIVKEMFCVTASMLQLFTPLKKGTIVSPNEVLDTVKHHVKIHNLQTPNGLVILDGLFSKIVGRPEQDRIRWDELMMHVESKMTACTEMTFADRTVKTVKTKLEPIKMQVATRSGNKKVTLVSNLEAFGFSLSELCKVCQVGVAASCCVTRCAASKTDQLLLQGDQTHFMAKLLIERYGLPKKFVEGADKALKKRNK